MESEKAVVLLSGGMDSATVLAIAKRENAVVFPLHIQYGQRHSRELQSATMLSKHYNTEPMTIVNLHLPWLARSKSPLVDSTVFLPSNRKPEEMTGIAPTYVPGRNTILLAIAMSYAETVGARRVYAGPNAEDVEGYPDCRPVYYLAMNNVAEVSSAAAVGGSPIGIITPVQNLNKAGIVKMGTTMNVPFELTWSCYTNRERPCGVCDTCVLRKRGFDANGIKDPLEG